MTLEEFNSLSPKEKEIAAMSGNFIADRREAGLTIALYGVDRFYVELWYDSATNEITMLHSFQSLKKLAPYLDRVKFEL
ncbi:hypothetical protein ACFFGT_05025 [Mucilaginibacter angelicae]|uniref:Uncharacterized protein n=1 Tax=Mucilaginibacter angelicae TaxID=869718 RepID=A0ABV6L382_9SPHI